MGKKIFLLYCMNVDDGRIMRSWRRCLFCFVTQNVHEKSNNFL
jgi:hypothetical protein